VTNEASRIAGMQSGDYHMAMEIGNDSYDLLKSDPSLRVDLLQPTNWEFIYLNWKSALTSQLKIRQAVQAAVNPAPMLAAGRGDQKFWELDPAFMLKSTAWWTDAGKELYNQNNPTKAKQLLQDAKYDGTPLRVLCTQEYPWSYSMAVVMKQQLEQAGFKIDLAVSDWATVVDRRQKPDQWESFITNHGWVPDPTQLDFVGKMNSYPGWYNSEATMKLANQLASESDFDKRFAIWKQLQTNIYNEIPGVKTGNSSNISVWSKKVGGFTPQQERGVPYWNVWLTK
jgi:peptide/nickel transport system substrate-binding protein